MGIQTVTGHIEADQLGYTLTHEHLFVNMAREYRGNGVINDMRLVSDEVAAFANINGRTIVDCTSIGFGRDPNALLRIAQQTGVNIVMGSGFYRDPYNDAKFLNEHDVTELADLIVCDIVVGVDGTDIRSGIIGEVGCDKWYASALEERSLRAAARAHLRTGTPITTHAARWPVGRVQLDIFEQEGVDPSSVIIGHCDWQADGESYHLDLARAGAYVQFDTIAHAMGEYDLLQTAHYVVNLIDNGFLDNILLSHDVCLRNQFGVFGGPGYTFISEKFSKYLKSAGVDEEAYRKITVDNPAKALEHRKVAGLAAGVPE